MATDYPLTLPVPQTMLVTPFDRAHRSDADRPREARAFSRDRLALVRATWPPLTPAQAAIFESFWRSDIYEGGAWFNADWPLPEGTVSAVYRFVEQPRWRFVPGGMWRIEGLLEKRGRTLRVVDGAGPGVASNPWNAANFTGPVSFADLDFTATMSGPATVVSIEAAEGLFGAAKYYAELVPTYEFFEGGASLVQMGVTRGNPGTPAEGGAYDLSGNVYADGALVDTFDAIASGEVVMIALDANAGLIYFGKNGTWLGGANPVTGEGSIFLGLTAQDYYLVFFGDNIEVPYSCAIRTGSDRFSYAVPSGYTAWNIQGV